MTWVFELYVPELRVHCAIQSIFVHTTRSINFCGTRMTAVDTACRCRQAALPSGPELRRPQSCRPLQVASTSLSFVHSRLLSSHSGWSVLQTVQGLEPTHLPSQPLWIPPARFGTVSTSTWS
jgi:hypothetical protein